jgi:2'-5' RNA ligase
MPRWRLGVALLIPPPVREEVDGLRRALGDPARGRIPAHLTLVPPVNVREDAIPDALAVLRDAAAQTPPLHLTLGPPATFLPDNPVIYLDVAGDLDALHALRDRVFVPPLQRPLTWPFVPHVTIADDAPPNRIPPALHALADFTVDVAIDRVHILREGDGRIWTPIADAPLSPAVIRGRGGLPLDLTTSTTLDPEAAAFTDAQWADEPDADRDDRTPLVVVARRAGRVVGTATGRTTHLSSLIVAADERGTGIGAHLVNAFIDAAASRGATAVTVRTKSPDFYRRLGWVDRGDLDDGFVRLGRTLE